MRRTYGSRNTRLLAYSLVCLRISGVNFNAAQICATYRYMPTVGYLGILVQGEGLISKLKPFTHNLRNIIIVIIITMIAPRPSSTLSIVLLALCAGTVVAMDTAFKFKGTGSVTLSCPEADDVCTPNGMIGSISGTFNIGGGSFKSREGGATSTFSEGSNFNIGGFESQATIFTCSEGCTCVLSDGETACSVGSAAGTDDGDKGDSAFSMNSQAPFFMTVAAGASLMALF